MRQEGWSHYSSCGQRQIVKKEKAMKANRALFLGAAILGSMACLAKADEWDQKTIFTFSAPVEVPGKVLLPGTYVFRLADSASDRNIIQVFNKNETDCTGRSSPSRTIAPSGRASPSSHSTSARPARRRPSKPGSILVRTTAMISFIRSRKRLRWPR